MTRLALVATKPHARCPKCDLAYSEHGWADLPLDGRVLNGGEVHEYKTCPAPCFGGIIVVLVEFAVEVRELEEQVDTLSIKLGLDKAADARREIAAIRRRLAGIEGALDLVDDAPRQTVIDDTEPLGSAERDNRPVEFGPERNSA